MTDQIPADKVRKIASEMRAAMRRVEDAYPDGEFLMDMSDYIRDLDKLCARARPRPTLADMTEEERDACQWMQADVEQQGRAVIILPYGAGGRAVMLDQWGDVTREDHADVTPRPDLPRMTWPGDKKPIPAPALPDGWRLADHQEYGRVIVTRPEPDCDGEFVIIRPHPHRIPRTDTVWCDPDELTFLDTGKEADQ